MGDDVRVRSLRPADAGGYIELLARIDAETQFLLWEPGERAIETEALVGHIEACDPTERLQLVAESDGRLVGFLVSHRGGPNRLRHRCDFTMAILSDQRRRGIGTLLVQALQDWARQQGIRRIELTVMAHNEAARSLYERSGFRVEGVKRGAIVVDGRPVDEVVMGMQLDAPTDATIRA